MDQAEETPLEIAKKERARHDAELDKLNAAIARIIDLVGPGMEHEHASKTLLNLVQAREVILGIRFPDFV